jgi:hypothetical protein
MNIATLQSEKTVKSLAARLLAEPTKDTPKSSQTELEAALVRLNPQLNKISQLDPGTPIVVPDGFALASSESDAPMQALADELLQQAESALKNLRLAIKERSDQFAAQSEQVQAWVKSQQAKDLVKESPGLKEVFSDAAAAAKTVAKEQPVALTAQAKALDKVAAQVAAFRVQRIG